VLSPLLKTLRQPPDYVEEYRSEFGYLGPALHTAVLKARTQPTPSPAASSACAANATATAAPTPPTIAAPTPRSLSGQTAIVQTGLSMSFILWETSLHVRILIFFLY
jgi:transcription initiation factor TFIID subunit 6